MQYVNSLYLPTGNCYVCFFISCSNLSNQPPAQVNNQVSGLCGSFHVMDCVVLFFFYLKSSDSGFSETRVKFLRFEATSSPRGGIFPMRACSIHQILVEKVCSVQFFSSVFKLQ